MVDGGQVLALNYSVGFVLFSNNFLKPCYMKESCKYPGTSKDVINLLNYQLNKRGAYFNLTKAPDCKNNVTYDCLFKSLQSGSIPMTDPYFTITYNRSQLFDFILPALMGTRQYKFIIHGKRPGTQIAFYSLISWKMYGIIILLDCLMCLYVMYARYLRTNSRVSPVIITNIIIDISLQQRSKVLWVSRGEKLLIWIWSLCMTRVLMCSIRASYASTMTSSIYPTVKNWNDITELLETHSYKFVMPRDKRSSVNALFKRDESNTKRLSQVLTSRNYIQLQGPTKVEEYVRDTPGTVTFGTDRSQRITASPAINMFDTQTMTSFISTMVSRVPFAGRKQLLTLLQLAAQNMTELGHIDYIIRKYFGTRSKNTLLTHEKVPIRIQMLYIAGITYVVGYGIGLVTVVLEVVLNTRLRQSR